MPSGPLDLSMLATPQPRAPHLLNAFSAYKPPPPPPLDIMSPSTTHQHVERSHTPTAERIKGLFSRSRVTSPEPDPTLRARLRSFIGDSKAGPSGPRGKKKENQRGFTPDGQTKRRDVSKRVSEYRPPTPDGTKRTLRFGPALLPAIQKGADGKWQPPSLSRGSLSTAALNMYAQDGEGLSQEEEEQRGKVNEKEKHQRPLSSLYSGRRPRPAEIQINHPKSDSTSPTFLQQNTPEWTRRPIHSSQSTSSALSSPTPCPRPSPTQRHTRSPSLLSRDHFLLRLATSYLIRSLTPIIRGTHFVHNDKTLEMRRIADDHISALARMEKGWGGDWARVAGEVGRNGEGVPGDTGALNETKLREVVVGNRAKERERKIWVDTVKDGVVFCLLLNDLFPSTPQHISRVNITEDATQRATNLTRFQTACAVVGLEKIKIFNISDFHDASEIGLGRVAWTIISLAQLAGPSKAAVGRSISPTPVTTRSPNQSRSPSRTGTHDVTVKTASPRSPHRLSPSKTTHVNTHLTGERRRTVEGANDLHVKLHVETSRPVPDPDDPAYRTPTSSGFVALPATPVLATPTESPRRQGLPRSTTQPNVSPLRPKSPSILDAAAGNSSPMRRDSRPTLRPRHTTGSKVQVSFADRHTDLGLSPGASVGHHGRERTPSLVSVSSGSRVTSGYTRSSTALSAGTIICDDDFHAIEIANDSPNNSLANRYVGGDMGGKTLQNARQKLGALLSSEDLPHDLRQELENSIQPSRDDPRNVALSKSLAALEGWRSHSARPSTELSPRRRSQSRPTSLSTRSGEVPRVAEEDDLVGIVPADGDGARRSMIRRLSSNGKTYIPKRTMSPSPRAEVSPITPSFQVSDSMVRANSDPSDDAPSSSVLAERRQSDGYPYGMRRSEEERPMNFKMNSMINLSSGVDSASVFRDNMIRAGRSQLMQVLEFHEPGFPPAKYQLGNCVGKGQFGSVYRSLNLGSGQMVAIKRIRLEGMKEVQVKDVMHEVELLKRLAHPSIVKYEGMSRDNEYLNIVLEYVENGSLGQVLKAFGKFNEKLTSSYVAKILEGLDYLHSQGVVHCDLKAANILSTKNGNVKLSDFGVSLNMKAVENLQNDAATASRNNLPIKRPVSDVAGTPNWMAPEVISLNGAVPASDIWSLGCTIIELLTGKPPFSEIGNSMSVLFRIVEDDMPPLPYGISDDLSDFLKLCFIKDPEYRPAAAVLFEHPWVKKLNPDLALRPQDSVPFLRRVSMDLRRIDSNRLFPSEPPEAIPGISVASDVSGSSDMGKRHRYSFASSHVRNGSDTHKEHTLIKTTFGKAILCRICHASVKKTGVLCQHCGLICHTACASRAPLRCDITEQLALLSRQQEFLAVQNPNIAISTASSRRTSHDEGHQESGTSLTALPGKIFNGLKRTKTGRSSFEFGDDRRRRSSTNLARSNSGLNLDPYRASSEANHQRDSYSHSRASVFTDGSFSDAGGSDTRRISTIRFDLNGDDNATRKVQVEEGRVEVVQTTPSTPMTSGKGKGHKFKDSKSDCVVM